MIRIRPLSCEGRLVRILVIVMLCGLTTPGWAVPSFARQTGMACAACHTVFPELTPFGREFKLNGYVLDNIKQVTGIDTADRQTLALSSLPPLSLMAQISYTHTSTALPDSKIQGALAKDGNLLFPQQVSLFYAGKIADGLGAFIQLTYDGVGNSFGFDNTDIRYAHHLSFGGSNDNSHSVIVGVTLNNNPTVQDVWNTTPAWGAPYSGSSVAPSAITSAKIDSGAGGFGQHVGDSAFTCGWMITFTLRSRVTPPQSEGVLIPWIAHRATWSPEWRLIGAWLMSNVGTATHCPSAPSA